MANTIRVNYNDLADDSPHNDSPAIKTLCDIVIHNDSARLRSFHVEHPTIRLTNAVIAGVRRSGLRSLGNVTPEFVDALFECNYITKSDIHILFTVMYNTIEYSSWAGIYHLFEMMDPELLRKTVCCYDGCERNALSTLQYTIISSYYGKLHPTAKLMYEKLISFGCKHINEDALRAFNKFLTVDIEWQEQHNKCFQEFKKTPEYQEWLLF